MTAKEHLIEAASEREVARWTRTSMLDGPTILLPVRHIIDGSLAHPDLLLAVLAEMGVLSILDESWMDRSIETMPVYRERRRYVSPWVPSGDQT